MMKYHDQMKHPLWQKKRLEVLNLHRFKCQNCKSEDDTLHVHHPFYKRGAMIWEYAKEELMCLCDRCHKEEHLIDEQLKYHVSLMQNRDKKLIIGFAKEEHEEICGEDEAFGALIYCGIRPTQSAVDYVICKKSTKKTIIEEIVKPNEKEIEEYKVASRSFFDGLINKFMFLKIA